MVVQQQTIKNPITLTGVGLHTGVDCTMRFLPAPENFGIRFRRIDLATQPEIPAIVDYVVEVTRGTTLALNGVKVHTVEHILAALVGLQVDNIIIELDNIEPPICDGSAKPFVEALLQAGIEKQSAPKDYLIIDQTIRYVDEKKGVDIVALPTDDYRVTVMIDYNSAVLGSQHSGLFDLHKEFISEFAPARTFCFLHEVEALHDQGLIRGGNLDNAIVVVDNPLSSGEIHRIATKLGITEAILLGGNGVLNGKQLLFKNEPARHKLIDLMGDLALIGVPLKAQILAARPGHASNIEFAKKVRKLYLQKALIKKYQFEKTEGVVLDINGIQRIIPHRFPFLFLDKIIEFKLDERIVGVKNVTSNEQFFQGHFPGQPVMPGVLILEAMAQTGGILMLNGIENPEGKLMMFTAMNNVKFRKPVIPGDQLILEMEMVTNRKKICIMKGRAFVDGNLVAEAEMSAAVVERNSK
ncbi:MAG: bifunctional UDP-3-O-[3-hydroxymyristoyl] N-acetylglucosamine deacetylase/3-hydroxyacyl-ACP dehydratase [Ignavibacteriales bacterium]|nr:bifunctional UDP-3-O-[3-hydroxymyristoyl] N-acetylglucosamine deacetylase/3-hydroxyacyl-ACP dehydratase [Ignavibacteriales bacterium]